MRKIILLNCFLLLFLASCSIYSKQGIMESKSRPSNKGLLPSFLKATSIASLFYHDVSAADYPSDRILSDLPQSSGNLLDSLMLTDEHIKLWNYGQTHNNDYQGISRLSRRLREDDAWDLGTLQLCRIREEFQVNSEIMGPQDNVQLTALLSGGFAMTFGQSSDEARLRVYDSSYSPIGLDIILNPEIGNSTEISRLVPSGLVISSDANAPSDVIGQIYDDLGNLVLSEFVIYNNSDGIDIDVEVEGLSDGNIISYYSKNFEILFGKVLNQMGEEVLPEFLVGDLFFLDNVTIFQEGPGLVDAGVTYEVISQSQAIARYFNVTPDNYYLIKNITIDEFQSEQPDSTASLNGDTAVTWVMNFLAINENNTKVGSAGSIVAKVYNNSGYPLTDQFFISDVSTIDHMDPAIDFLSDDNLGITWYKNQDVISNFSIQDIFVKVVDKMGNTIVGEIQVNNDSISNNIDPYISGLDNERFVVVWMGTDINDDINNYGQVFLNDGTRLGPNFIINNYTDGSQDSPVTAFLDNDTFIATWISSEQDGDQEGVFARLFQFVDPTPAPTNAPSYSPSIAPSGPPSISPSNAPTIPPSSAPTDSPSLNPTLSPTFSPSRAPTNFPTQIPSNAPSSSPTYSPSIAPSSPPSISPSNAPTIPPSSAPTDSPSINPSTAPTFSPTYSPTTAPTLSPTANPSFPTDVPTFSPTAFPTSSPTSPPTLSPTHPPTNSPTSPTGSPTPAPTGMPTPAPTAAPSPPTSSPTNAPTDTPTPPSVSPTTAPSMSPSKGPTPAPTPLLSPGEAAAIWVPLMVIGILLLALLAFCIARRIIRLRATRRSYLILYNYK